MPKIKVTTVDANHIKVEFQDYHTNGQSDKKVAWYNRNKIELVEEYDNMITVQVLEQSKE